MSDDAEALPLAGARDGYRSDQLERVQQGCQDAYRSRQIGLVQQAVQSNRVFKITVCGITHPNMGVTMFHRSLHDVLQAVQLTQMIQDGSHEQTRHQHHEDAAAQQHAGW